MLSFRNSETNLHAQNRIQQAPLFQQCKDKLKDIDVLVKYAYDANE